MSAPLNPSGAPLDPREPATQADWEAAWVHAQNRIADLQMEIRSCMKMWEREHAEVIWLQQQLSKRSQQEVSK